MILESAQSFQPVFHIGLKLGLDVFRHLDHLHGVRRHIEFRRKVLQGSEVVFQVVRAQVEFSNAQGKGL